MGHKPSENMNVNYFLKILAKEGYPNSSIQSIAKAMGYNIDEFLYDLKKEIGEDGVLDFCNKTIEKLGGKEGIKVDLEGSDGNEYCYIKIYPIHYDEDESENDVISESRWGNSRILSTDSETGEETFKTIEQIIDETDMGGWSELDELIDHIKNEAYKIVFRNCGFGIWWE
jgi:formylmethanofuran dehydrogenase subunit D